MKSLSDVLSAVTPSCPHLCPLGHPSPHHVLVCRFLYFNGLDITHKNAGSIMSRSTYKYVHRIVYMYEGVYEYENTYLGPKLQEKRAHVGMSSPQTFEQMKVMLVWGRGRDGSGGSPPLCCQENMSCVSCVAALLTAGG